jgi:precorrin-8X/cobalt-precorrin-8 methylmutase
MIGVGLSAPRLASFGAEVHDFIDDPGVIARAKANATTRAVEAMREARPLLHGGIVAIGNAPTALLEIVRLHREEGITPALVLGMPVGFVNAAESKELLMTTAIPCVVTRGRKGGSTITVAALHALMNVAAGDLR